MEYYKSNTTSSLPLRKPYVSYNLRSPLSTNKNSIELSTQLSKICSINIGKIVDLCYSVRTKHTNFKNIHYIVLP